MTDAVDEHAVRDPETAVTLVALAAEVEWPDADAAAQARAENPGGRGRLAELTEWLAGAQGEYPPVAPKRARAVFFGQPSMAVTELADDLAVGVRTVPPVSGDVPSALAEGAAVADDEIDAGTDLAVVAVPEPDADAGYSAASLVSVVTGAEPVALLPRGAAATDTAAWVAGAERLRDGRRAVAELRGEPDALLAALGDANLAAVLGFVLRAVSRRTPLVLDGAVALAAALLAYDVQSRCGRWWRVADASPDPVHARAADELVAEPLLALGLAGGDGLAGLLSIPLLRAATRLGQPDE